MDRNEMFASVFNTLISTAGKQAASTSLAHAFANLAKDIVNEHFVEPEEKLVDE